MSDPLDCTIGVRTNRWPSIIFLGGVSAMALIACPIYLVHNRLHPATWALFIALSVSTVIAITAGYHRLFAHRTYQAQPLYRFFMLALGAATFQQSAYKWASLHRTHHRFTDTERDPYNIKKGFFYAHMGWILFYERKVDYSNVKDLESSAMLMNQHRYFQRWALLAGVALPLALGALYGRIWEAALFGGFARLFLVFQVTFFINSFAHTFGKATYDRTVSARDNWVGAFLTGGEGYHSFHHRFPNDYRNGVRWYHWDPSKWFIWASQRMGWTWALKRSPQAAVAEALTAAS